MSASQRSVIATASASGAAAGAAVRAMVQAMVPVPQFRCMSCSHVYCLTCSNGACPICYPLNNTATGACGCDEENNHVNEVDEDFEQFLAETGQA